MRQVGLFSPSHDRPINDIREVLVGSLGIVVGKILIMQSQFKLHTRRVTTDHVELSQKGRLLVAYD